MILVALMGGQAHPGQAFSVLDKRLYVVGQGGCVLVGYQEAISTVGNDLTSRSSL
jgi:hypothetical protein